MIRARLFTGLIVAIGAAFLLLTTAVFGAPSTLLDNQIANFILWISVSVLLFALAAVIVFK